MASTPPQMMTWFLSLFISLSIFFLRRQTKPTFYATVLSHSFTSELPELDFVRIVGEGGEPVLPGVEGVDIAKADLHKFTNSAGA